MTREFYLGVDLGQRQDHTALAFVEHAAFSPEPGFDYVRWLRTAPPAAEPPQFHLLGLTRLPLGTPYTTIVERVRSIALDASRLGRCVVIVDGTGVGGAVVDLLRAASLGPARLVPVLITGAAGVHHDRDWWTVPKQELLGTLQVLFETRRLKIAARLGPAARLLVDEMMAMRARTTHSGRRQYGAFASGSHDDLVLALALACWRAQWDQRPSGEINSGRLL